MPAEARSISRTCALASASVLVRDKSAVGCGGNSQRAAVAEAGVNEQTRNALHRSQVIDLTTTGRRSGEPRRIEIFLHDLDGTLFITGMPRADRTRGWIHNISSNPDVIVHLKQGASADVPATARVITDREERRPLIEAAARRWGRDDLDVMMAHSPLIVLTAAHAASD